jgi:hypothetical protein
MIPPHILGQTEGRTEIKQYTPPVEWGYNQNIGVQLSQLVNVMSQ